MPKPSRKMLAEGFFQFKKQAGPGLCWVKGCANSAHPNGSCLCSKHMMQRWRKKNPAEAAYANLKGHARQRRIDFTISKDYWAGLTDGMAYFEPNEDEVATIDRIDPTKGYVPGNLRVISMSLNVAKGNRERHLPEHVQEMLRRSREGKREAVADHLEDEEDNCPF